LILRGFFDKIVDLFLLRQIIVILENTLEPMAKYPESLKSFNEYEKGLEKKI
jgi:hypothetical protein